MKKMNAQSKSKYLLAALALTVALIPAVACSAEHYDFRSSAEYKALSEVEREKLETVHRDFTLLWGALDKYADDHSGSSPESLSQLVPRYLRELPRDPFATKASAAEQDTRYYKPSKDGYGYRYRQGVGRSWVIASVGLTAFPYLSNRGNVDLYVAKGMWLSGRQALGQGHTQAKQQSE